MKANCQVRTCGAPIVRRRTGRPKKYCASCAKDVQAAQIRKWRRSHPRAKKVA